MTRKLGKLWTWERPSGPAIPPTNSWIQNRIQLAPARPKVPKKDRVANPRINRIDAEVKIRNQQVAGSIPAGGSIVFMNFQPIVKS
jgi:hypothetical protein